MSNFDISELDEGDQTKLILMFRKWSAEHPGYWEDPIPERFDMFMEELLAKSKEIEEKEKRDEL